MENIHMAVGRLGDKDRGHRQVDGGAIEVERIAGRDHEAHHRFAAAQLLHLVEHSRQR